jgi:UDP-GlcNAc:undecaprenyl-phosphate GlcNAc-1-phosphate transferase
MPRLGGVAVFIAIFIALAILPFLNNSVTQSLRSDRLSLWTALGPASLMLLLGIYDDLRGANPRFKFIMQALAGILFYLIGGRVEALNVPFLGGLQLPQIVSFGVTLLWVVGISNAFNLIDGVDGLAAGAALFASLVMLVVSLVVGNVHVTILTLALSGALIGFLRYNFNPASIFLGDSGSLFIGFLLAALSVQGGLKASTAIAVAIPFMAFGVPIIDMSFAIARRFISRQPLFQGDREHIHHMLLARGWSQRRVVFVLYGVCAAFGLTSLLFVSDAGRLTGLILLVVGSAVILAVGKLRYHEVDEIKASLKRNIGERRIRAANHLRIRRASRAMSKADNLGELFGAVRELLDLGEFAHATVQIGRDGDPECTERLLAQENGLSHLGVELRNGLICWSWVHKDVNPVEVIGSGKYWTLSLPLSTGGSGWGYINLYRPFESDALLLDINYLCQLFWREMAQAVERLLTAVEREDDGHRIAMTSEDALTQKKIAAHVGF